MTALAQDNFNRADVNPLDGSWATTTGLAALKIVSNAVAAATGATDSAARNTAITWPNDQYTEITLSTTGTNDGGPCARLASGAYTVYFTNSFDGSTHMSKVIAGVGTEIGLYAVSWTTNDVLRIDAQGTTIRALKNGAVLGSATDSAITSGSPGIFMFDGSIRFDNFVGGDFTGPELMGRPDGARGQAQMAQLLAT